MYSPYFENADRVLHLSIIGANSKEMPTWPMCHSKKSHYLPAPLKNTGEWDCNEFHATKYLLHCKTEKTLLVESVNLVQS